MNDTKLKAKAVIMATKMKIIDSNLDKMLRVIPEIKGNEQAVQKILNIINQTKIEINGEDNIWT